MTLRPLPDLRELQKSELNGAAQLLGRGMCDNPVNVSRIWHREPRAPRAAMSLFFFPVLEGLYRRGLVIGAFNDAKLVGVCGMARPQPANQARWKSSECSQGGFGQSNPCPVASAEVAGEWARRDPKEPHWHLDQLQWIRDCRAGNWRAMLTRFCAAVDEKRELAYLVSDKSRTLNFISDSDSR